MKVEINIIEILGISLDGNLGYRLFTYIVCGLQSLAMIDYSF